MSFYRIYRPQVIDEVDNIAVRERLLTFLRKNRKDLPHAYLFSGPKGTGKTTAARLVAKLFNCTKLTGVGPCGKCDQCRTIASGTNMDVLEIDAASNRGIDEMRTLRERIALAPVSAGYKVYVIDEVHMLTTEAFNALLKTLEEPPLHAVFVLATTDLHKVPATIISRCIHIPFSRAARDELVHALGRIVRKEGIKIEKDALIRIADLADGSFRDAVKLLEQVSLAKGKLTVATVEKLASAATDMTTSAFVGALWNADAKAAITLIEEFVKEGGDPRTLLTQSLTYMHDRLVANIEDPKTTGLPPVMRQKQILEVLTASYATMRVSPIAHLPLELAVVELCAHEEAQAVTQGAPVVGKTEEELEPLGLLTLEKLVEHWSDVIAATKPYNHSVSGVLRSTRPGKVSRGIVTITAFYNFHKEKLSETKNREILSSVLKKLFGEQVKVEIELGKKGT
jgi:DNA polymerase-3 subunit gamma/tau